MWGIARSHAPIHGQSRICRELDCDDRYLSRTELIPECLRADGHSALFIDPDPIAASSLLTQVGVFDPQYPEAPDYPADARSNRLRRLQTY